MLLNKCCPGCSYYFPNCALCIGIKNRYFLIYRLGLQNATDEQLVMEQRTLTSPYVDIEIKRFIFEELKSELRRRTHNAATQ